MPVMVYALLICSDADCAAEVESAGTLEELGALACDCGCAMQVLTVSDVEFVEPAWEWEYSLPLAA